MGDSVWSSLSLPYVWRGSGGSETDYDLRHAALKAREERPGKSPRNHDTKAPQHRCAAHWRQFRIPLNSSLECEIRRTEFDRNDQMSAAASSPTATCQRCCSVYYVTGSNLSCSMGSRSSVGPCKAPAIRSHRLDYWAGRFFEAIPLHFQSGRRSASRLWTWRPVFWRNVFTPWSDERL